MNNFDTSTCGIDIELSMHLDGCMSQHNFQESFVQIESGMLKGKWLYVDYGNLFYAKGYEHWDFSYFEPEFKILTEERLASVKMMRYCTQMDKYACYSDYKDMYMDEIFDDWCYDMKFEEKREFLEEVGLEYELDLPFIEGATRGYCQGDYAEYIYIPKLLRQIWGTSEDIKDEDLLDSEYIDNLFWDAPMHVRAEINGEEYYVEEFDGQYQGWHKDENGKNSYWGFDKEKCIDNLVQQVGNFDTEVDLNILREQLEDLVPEELEYDY